MDDFVKMVEATLKDDRDRFFNFLSLVKRMREAQEAFQNAISSEDIDQIDMCQIRMLDLEREVDEYLKKIEDNGRRKALEAENTEFEYGHDVKHYREY